MAFLWFLQLNVEINKDQPSESKQRLFLEAWQEAVMAADSLAFGQKLKDGQRWGKALQGENGKAPAVPWLEAVGLGKLDVG